MRLTITVLAVALLGQIPYGLGYGGACLMAQHTGAVAAQQDDNPDRREREVPDGHWCQRAQPRMDRKAHACSCHQHDCGDPDPNHVSAHTDPKCLDFCKQKKCFCERMDCP